MYRNRCVHTRARLNCATEKITLMRNKKARSKQINEYVNWKYMKENHDKDKKKRKKGEGGKSWWWCGSHCGSKQAVANWCRKLAERKLSGHLLIWIMRIFFWAGGTKWRVTGRHLGRVVWRTVGQHQLQDIVGRVSYNYSMRCDIRKTCVGSICQKLSAYGVATIKTAE